MRISCSQSILSGWGPPHLVGHLPVSLSACFWFYKNRILAAVVVMLNLDTVVNNNMFINTTHIKSPISLFGVPPPISFCTVRPMIHIFINVNKCCCSYGYFLKWWYPQNTPKWSILVGKTMVVEYHHFRKHPYVSYVSMNSLCFSQACGMKCNKNRRD